MRLGLKSHVKPRGYMWNVFVLVIRSLLKIF